MPIQNLAVAIINSLKGPDTKSKITLSTEDVAINIYQVLRYGLLLNELLYQQISQVDTTGANISIRIVHKNGQVTTTIASNTTDKAMDMDEIHQKDIVQALLRQLGDTIETGSKAGVIYELNFNVSSI